MTRKPPKPPKRRNPIAKAVRLKKPKMEKPKKGRGSYNRRQANELDLS
jgi:stalled ribosome alternative rescue factor ArfA